jgi:hypothetical protein
MRTTKKLIGIFLAAVLVLNSMPIFAFADSKNVTISYQLLSDWGNGYSGQIVIENLSGQPVNNWSLEFYWR